MTCSYAKCTNESQVKRRYTGDGEIYSYCSGHDPLQGDKYVQDVFEEVNDG